jgi:hypothetical protein
MPSPKAPNVCQASGALMLSRPHSVPRIGTTGAAGTSGGSGMVLSSRISATSGRFAISARVALFAVTLIVFTIQNGLWSTLRLVSHARRPA